MTLNELQTAKNAAMKVGDKIRVVVLSEMIGAIQQASMAGKTRIEITEELVNETLLKVQKTYQEMVDTCPGSREELFELYNIQLSIVDEYAPKLETDRDFIRAKIQAQIFSTGLALTKKNKGAIMKMIVPIFKGKADMKIVSEVLGEMLV